ncbi:MAG: DNA primase [Alphaproteobacteria bacterium]|nr:DNA primase [Alphaproteobacteria bacterium]
MRFSPEFLDRLRSQVTISEIVGRRVALKRRGREYQGLCPFHHEKSPSFTVNDEKGFYHCFGCSAHGDAIRFLTESEGMHYVEAVERLANEVGLPVPQMSQEQVAVAKRFGSLQEVMEAACQWYELQLRTHKVAQDYLKSRGLTGHTAKHFRLGFAPEGRDALKTHLMSHGVNERQLQEVGLIIRPDGGGASYDRFRARVMFPITDRRGKVIAFGGRVIPSLIDAGRDAPKYLNSPETPLFKKGEVLYAYESARQPAHKANQVLVTEGYMDVIALYQAGFNNAVAPLGTAVTENHLRLLWQLADEPVMCLDGDAAGQRAMQRAGELSLPLLKAGKSLRFLILPKGEDPDTMVRKQGAEAFKTRLDTSLTLSDALWRQQAGDLNKKTSPEKRAAIEHTLMQLCDKIADKTVSNHYRAYFKKLLWPERQSKIKAKYDIAASRSSDVERFMLEGEQAIQHQRERDLLRLIMQHPSLLQLGEVEEIIGMFDFTHVDYNRIRQLIMDVLAENPELPHDLVTIRAQEQGLEHPLTALLNTHVPHASGEDAERHALTFWKLLVAEHALTRMQAECRSMEAEIADNVTEDSYARLVALKKQIAEAQQHSSNLQNALEE